MSKEAEEHTAQATQQDLKESALAHYEDVASKAHHYSSVIPKAIEFYFSEKNQPPWISVEERLPEPGYEYVVAAKNGMVGVAYYESGGTEYRFHREDYDGFEHEDVSHWMPLPKPPKS